MSSKFWSPRRLKLGMAVAALVAAGVLIPWHMDRVSGAPGVDTTDSLQAQLDGMRPGGYLKLDPQVYEHRGVLKLRVPDVTVDGNGATLEATNDETSAVQITADRVQLTNVTLAAPADGQRWQGLNQHKLVISGSGDTVSGVSIHGSAAAGIFVDGAQGFKIQGVDITGTRADGIHMTHGSRNGVVDGANTAETGDDAVAVVSYLADGQLSRDIQISHVTVASTRWGRGISVVGGSNVSVSDFSVANTNAAGLYVATEGKEYKTGSVDGVTMSGGSVTGGNHDPGVVQGAVLVYAGNSGQSVRNVQISGVTISGTSGTAQRNVGVLTEGGSLQGVSLDDIHIDNSSLPPLFSNAPRGSYSTSGWTVDGSPASPG